MRLLTASALAFVLVTGVCAPVLADDQSAGTVAATTVPQLSLNVVSQDNVSTALGGVALSNVASAVPVDSTGLDASATEAAPTSGADTAMWNSAASTAAAPHHVTAVREHARVAEAVRPTEQAGHVVAETGHASPSITGLAAGLFARTRELASRLTSGAMRFLGVPYVFGGTTAGGFDCSGYVQHVFAMFGINLPRTADAQFLVGRRVASAEMSRGDLVFFQTYAPGASHVGIYLGDGKFIHSGSGGVQVSSLREAYWAEHYLGARHVIGATKLFAGRSVN